MNDNERIIKSNKKTLIIIVIGVCVIIFFTLLLLWLIIKPKDKNIDLENNLLKVGKEYYEKENILPSIVGECSTTTLEKLLSKNKIENPGLYKDCNKYISYVKVCKLGINDYHYTPILNCSSINSNAQYLEWNYGDIKSIDEKSDVRFLFLVSQKKDTLSDEILEAWEDELKDINYEKMEHTTYYRYRDKEWLWQEVKNSYYTNNDVGDVLAYYTAIPNSSYLNSDSQTTTYKWYRNIVINKDLQKVYICKSEDSDETVLSLNDNCINRVDGKTKVEKEYYTCGVKDSFGNYIEVLDNEVCDCSKNELGNNCEIRKYYYPSGENDASKEFVYYKEKPIPDAIKDVLTRETKTFRYYKEETIVTNKYYSNKPSSNAVKVGDGRFKEWSTYTTIKPKNYDTREVETRVKVKYKLKEENNWHKISDEYLELEEVINKLQKLGYEVKSLKDIKDNNNLKYELKIQYRNKSK